MKIYAPVKSVNGVYASVRFVNGVGETNDPSLIEWFKTHGYKLEDQKVEQAATVTLDDKSCLECQPSDLPDFESMTPFELRDWGREHGLGGQIKGIRNREKLLEIIRG